MHLISVIMPAYNAENWIMQAIDSVVAQTWTDWELVVVFGSSVNRTVPFVGVFLNRGIQGSLNTKK